MFGGKILKWPESLKTHIGYLLCQIPSLELGAWSEEVWEKVQQFYEDDKVSRICPVKKDYVSGHINGEWVHKQKWLLLANVDELYSQFKEREKDCVNWKEQVYFN